MANKLLILVIDDDESVLAYAVDALRTCGYRAIGASTPSAAMEVIRTVPSLRLVLSDVALGPTTGPALVRQALRHRPDLKVVFMTGGSTDVLVRRSDPVLAKPFQVAELCETIERVLKAKPTSERPKAGVERRRRQSCS